MSEALAGRGVPILSFGLGLITSGSLRLALAAGCSTQHVIIDDPERLPELPLELRANALEDISELRLREIGGKVLDGLNVVLGPDALVLGVWGREELEQRSRVITQDLEGGARVRSLVPLAEKPHQ